MRVVLTGGGSGIGRAVARALLARGDEAVLTARSQERADEIAADLPGASFLVADLAHPGTLNGLGRDLAGPVDALVHCAGVVTLAPVSLARLDDWQRQLDVNLISPAVLTRELLPLLRESKGQVIFVNSTAGLQAGAGWSAYAASKFGLHALADSLRAEEPDIAVTSVFPSRTATPMQRSVREQEGAPYNAEDWMSPESVATAILGVLDLPSDAAIIDLTVKTR